MRLMGWATPIPGQDIGMPHRLDAATIGNITLDATQLNLLAMVFFVARHADADARARCTFIPVSTEGDR